MFTLKCRGRLIVVDKPLVMGILNITPDSFFSGSRVLHNEQDLLALAEKMIREGADILDIGAQSTRPGAEIVGADEELERLAPVIETLSRQFPDTILSVDTFHSAVANFALESGAHLINDISGGSFDPNILDVVAAHNAPYVCMHVKGSAATMHQENSYNQLMPEIIDYFIQRAALCREKGIQDLIIDPGFGFSKNSHQNFHLLKNLELLQVLQLPVLLGLSRKSTIYKTLGIPAEEALNGTTVLNTIGLLKGISILRVHDVKQAKEAVTLLEHYKSSGQTG